MMPPHAPPPPPVEHHHRHPLGSGTYGCVTELVKRCGGKDKDKDKGKGRKKKYVSKIMAGDKSVLFEVQVGQLVVAAHPHDYHVYFAPVEEACPVDLVELRELRKRVDLAACSSHAIQEELQKSAPAFMLLNERFVGTTDFTEFATASSSRPGFTRTKFLQTMLRCHIHLLTGAERLIKMHVMHMDLSANNVLMNAQARPVIIDFGLAFQHDPGHDGNAELPNPLTVFFVYNKDYPPWCIEIVLINYLIHHTVLRRRPQPQPLPQPHVGGGPPAPKLALTDAEILAEMRSRTLDDDLLLKLRKVVDEYLASNGLFSADKKNNFVPGFGEDAAAMKKAFRKDWAAFLALALNMPLHTLYARLLAECPSWDNYGLAALFLQTTASDHGGDRHRPQHIAYRRMMLDLVFYCPRGQAQTWADAAATRRPGAAKTLNDLKIAQTTPPLPTPP